MKAWQAGVLLFAGLIVLGAIMGPYRYDHAQRYGQTVLIRTSRWGGQSEYLSQGRVAGWLPLSYVPPEPVQ